MPLGLPQSGKGGSRRAFAPQAAARRKGFVATSRVDFDKNTAMILDANRLGANIKWASKANGAIAADDDRSANPFPPFTCPIPVIQAAPAPPPPSLRVTPAEVNETNYGEAAKRLMEELEADRKSIESMPRYAEVSVIPGTR